MKAWGKEDEEEEEDEEENEEEDGSQSEAQGDLTYPVDNLELVCKNKIGQERNIQTMGMDGLFTTRLATDLNALQNN